MDFHPGKYCKRVCRLKKQRRKVLRNFGFSDLHFAYSLFPFSPLRAPSPSESTVYAAQDPHKIDSFCSVQNLLTGTLTQRFVPDYCEVFSCEQQFITDSPYRHTNPR